MENGVKITVPTLSNTQISDGESLRHLALSGVGLARLATHQTDADIAAGKLVAVLEWL